MIKTTKKELFEALKQLKLPKNSTTVVHSSLYSLGFMEGGLDGIYQVFQNVLSKEGTVIVPTYSYSFFNKQKFNPNSTPSEKSIGVFSEYMRKKPQCIRSNDPLFSMAAIGPRAAELMKRESSNCFGKNSIFDKIFRNEAYFIGLGLTYSNGMSAFMHIEKMANVPYRFDKTFFGISLNGNKEIADSAVHFARKKKFFKSFRTNREKIGEMLEKKGISIKKKIGYGFIYNIKGNDWLEFLVKKLKKDPLCMLEKISKH